MTTMTEGEVNHFLERFEALTDHQRGRVCWEFARLSWKRDGERPLWQRANHALPFVWFAISYWLGIRERRRPAGEQLTQPQRVAWLLLILAGVCVATGQPWATPAAVFLCVSSMAAWRYRAWCELAGQLGAGWPKR